MGFWAVGPWGSAVKPVVVNECWWIALGSLRNGLGIPAGWKQLDFEPVLLLHLVASPFGAALWTERIIQLKNKTSTPFWWGCFPVGLVFYVVEGCGHEVGMRYGDRADPHNDSVLLLHNVELRYFQFCSGLSPLVRGTKTSFYKLFWSFVHLHNSYNSWEFAQSSGVIVLLAYVVSVEINRSDYFWGSLHSLTFTCQRWRAFESFLTLLSFLWELKPIKDIWLWLTLWAWLRWNNEGI